MVVCVAQIGIYHESDVTHPRMGKRFGQLSEEDCEI